MTVDILERLAKSPDLTEEELLHDFPKLSIENLRVQLGVLIGVGVVEEYTCPGCNQPHFRLRSYAA